MKRLLCILTAAALAFIPMPVSAEETDTPEVYTGQCGDNITWELKDSVLTLTGTGATYDYLDVLPDGEYEPSEIYTPDSDGVVYASPFSTRVMYDDAPIPDNELFGITEIRVGEGITELGEMIFCDNPAEKVILPSTLERIGDYCFNVMQNLNEIEIPDSVRYIGECAFQTTALHSVRIPPLVTELRATCFTHCPLEEISIPDTVTSIGSYCFSDTNIKDIRLPDGLTKLSDGLFDHCRFLEKIEIPENVTEIGEKCFYWCSSLQSITLPDACRTIGELSFGKCYNIKELHLSASLKAIPAEAFRDCRLLEEADIPDSVTKIGHNSFIGCDALKTVHFPDNPELEIDPVAFPDSFFENQEDFVIIGDHILYRYCGSEINVILPDDIKTIGSRAFYKNNVQSVTVSDGTTDISRQAFFYCNDLKTVTVPDSVVSLEQAFDRCTALESLSGPYYSAAHSYALAHNLQFIPTDTPAEIAPCKDDHTEETLSFGNGGGVFGNTYALTPWAEAALNDQAADTPMRAKADVLRRSAWSGSCFGLAALTVLTASGHIALSDLDADAETLHDVRPSEDVIGAINYYHLLQNAGRASEADAFLPPQAEMVCRVAKLASEYLESGVPFILNYGSENSGHAVVGFGSEAGDWEWNGAHYDRRVHIWDSNYTKQSDRTQFYFNSETLHYAIPAYSSYFNGTEVTGKMQLMHPLSAEEIRSYSGSYFDTKPLPGDADLSGAVNTADAVYLARIINEQTNTAPISYRGIYNSDADADGVLELRDVQAILQKI